MIRQYGDGTDVAVDSLRHRRLRQHCGGVSNGLENQRRVEKSRSSRFQRARKLIIIVEFSAGRNMLRILLLFCWISAALAAEWDCSATSGEYTLSTTVW